MWQVLTYLEAANDLIEDTLSLRQMGLTEEDIEGYQEFFHNKYFPSNIEEA